MPLTRVTITGADDGVDPEFLVDVGKTYPFVEWAILYSTKLERTPRYPSPAWRGHLTHVAEREGNMALALHLCGRISREVCEGAKWGSDILHLADRVQLNGYNTPSFPPCSQDVEYILQVRDEALLENAAYDAIHIGGGASILFDASGGRGIAPAKWPTKTFVNPFMGYAGGITPENVVEVVEAIGPQEDPFWIDLESGVRSENKFDVHRVLDLLDRVAPYVKKRGTPDNP